MAHLATFGDTILVRNIEGSLFTDNFPYKVVVLCSLSIETEMIDNSVWENN